MPPPPAIAASADEIVFVDRKPAFVATPISENVFTGIGLIVASTIFFSAGDIAAKILTEDLPPMQVAWLRYSSSRCSSCRRSSPRAAIAGFATSRPGLQVVRGLAVVISSVFFMIGLQHLQVAETTAINFISPVFITALSIPLLGEKVGARRWAAAASALPASC